jgi:hypothetical protein
VTSARWWNRNSQPYPFMETSIWASIHAWKYLHKSWGTQVRVYSTCVEHRNKWKHTEKCGKDSFTLLPQALKCSTAQSLLLGEVRRYSHGPQHRVCPVEIPCQDSPCSPEFHTDLPTDPGTKQPIQGLQQQAHLRPCQLNHPESEAANRWRVFLLKPVFMSCRGDYFVSCVRMEGRSQKHGSHCCFFFFTCVPPCHALKSISILPLKKILKAMYFSHFHLHQPALKHHHLFSRFFYEPLSWATIDFLGMRPPQSHRPCA